MIFLLSNDIVKLYENFRQKSTKLIDGNKVESVTPGLTENWATNGRGCTRYEHRMEKELFYVENISLELDIEILFKTIENVIKREGTM